MTVYVDALRRVSTSRRWSHDEAAYLIADTLEELHAFAERLGLKRADRFVAGNYPHYDIHRREHEAARKLGAGGLDRDQTVALLHTIRGPLTIEQQLYKVSRPLDQKQLLPPPVKTRAKRAPIVERIVYTPPPPEPRKRIRSVQVRQPLPQRSKHERAHAAFGSDP